MVFQEEVGGQQYRAFTNTHIFTDVDDDGVDTYTMETAIIGVDSILVMLLALLLSIGAA